MIKIVVDSGCDFNNTVKEDYGIDVSSVPLNLQLEQKLYVDDENLDMDMYLAEMNACPSIPKTSAPSPDTYLEKYKGTESVFAITISSKLSSSYNSAVLAKDMYLDEFGQKFIHVFDSVSASVGETLIALKINEFSKKGFGDMEIVEGVNKFISSMNTYFILEKLDNLTKTGRMKPYIAKIASVLNIKPICRATPEGTIELADKARGYKKAAARLIEIMASQKLDYENRILGISHVKCQEKALAFKEEVMKKMNFKDIFILEASGLCSTYADNEGIIIAY